MSTADLAVLGLTAESLTATVGCLRLALQIARGTAQQQEREADGVPTVPAPTVPLNGTRADRQAQFDRLRAEDMDPVEAAAALGLKPETAKKYERRRKVAQNGAGSLCRGPPCSRQASRDRDRRSLSRRNHRSRGGHGERTRRPAPHWRKDL